MVTRQASTGRDLGSLRIDERARKKSSPARRALIYVAILAVLLVALGLFFAFNNRKPAVDVVLVQNPENQQVIILNASGYVTPRRRATVAARLCSAAATRASSDSSSSTPGANRGCPPGARAAPATNANP